MKKKTGVFVAIAGAIIVSMTHPQMIFKEPIHFPKAKYNFENNPITKEKIYLGRVLFYDPILSRDQKIACSNCHSPYNAFTHVDHALSHGIEDREGKRNSPALMNLAWQSSFMWDGAINHLDMQSLFPIEHPDEMGEKIEHVVEKLNERQEYRKLFFKAYGDSIITGEHLLKALASFMVTLVSANSKYDSVKRNTSVFSQQELRGYALFKKNCAACHAEPLFTNFDFVNNGLPMDTGLKDYGRMKVTRNATDSLKFKVPTLRNIEFTYPYMHDGRFKNLREVLDHYSNGVQHSRTTSVILMNRIALNAHEKVDLISFLLTLTDRSFLFDSAYSFSGLNNKKQ